jgi:prolyl oligopeptidase PreP (S9A serine peptidase family)
MGVHDYLPPPPDAFLMVRSGLLVAACVNRAPEGTFSAAICEVGVLDFLKVMIDYQLFTRS